MSNFSQFTGGVRVVTSVVNGTTNGTPTPASVANGKAPASRSYASGALTANILARPTGFSLVSGAGVLKYCAVRQAGVTSIIPRLQIKIDGVTVYDKTASSTGSTDDGIVGCGAYANGTPIWTSWPFSSSLDIQIADTSTATDRVAVDVVYELT